MFTQQAASDTNNCIFYNYDAKRDSLLLNSTLNAEKSNNVNSKHTFFPIIFGILGKNVHLCTAHL